MAYASHQSGSIGWGDFLSSWKGTFSQIASDIRSGKNIDLYLTFPVAIAVIALTLIGVAAEKAIPGLISALLSLLAVASLNTRRQNDDLREILQRSQAQEGLANRFFWRRHDVEQVKDLILGSSREVWLWGATLSMHVSELKPTIEQALARGISVKVLLISQEPEGAMPMAAWRAGHPDRAELEDELSTNLRKLRQIVGRANTATEQPGRGHLEVRLINYLAPYTIYGYDPFGPTGRLDIRLSGIHTAHDARPGFTLQAARDGDWYNHFKNQLDAAWRLAATEIESEK